MSQHFSWSPIQRALKERLSADDFRAWIVPLQVLRCDANRIVLEAPNDRFVAILEEGLKGAIDAAADEIFGPDSVIEITARQLALGGVAFTAESSGRNNASAAAQRTGTVANQDPIGRIEVRRNRPAKAALVATQPAQAPLQPTSALLDSEFPLGSTPTTTTEGISTGSAIDSVQPPQQQPGTPSVTPSTSGAQAPQTSTRFNPKYRFSNFVVGDSNQFACAAARAVAESPGQSYNPLFLYGGVGLGKTHLLHAIAQEILHGQPNLQVHYISAEQFLNELINSIRFDRMPLFRERYRSIDVLLIDDIQFLANKERTQEEFFHTFNALYTAEKQIILSSDASPKDIPTLEERLRSRFEWGLITDIQPPDLETKIAILRRKAALRRCELDDEVAMFIASQVRSNVRELEGLLNRAIAFASMTGRALDLDLARETLKEILPQTDSRRNAAEIIRRVAKAYGLKVSEIKSKNKAHQISFPRQVAMYLCKQLTDLSFPEIGKQFSNKHHSTVMHSVEKITKLRAEDAELDRLIERLVLQLR